MYGLLPTLLRAPTPDDPTYDMPVQRDYMESFRRPLFNFIPESARLFPPNRNTDANQFQVMFNVKHFSPDDLEVKTVDNYVVIHGSHDQQADDHGFVSREFTRRYLLPDDVEPSTVVSFLTHDGILVIQAPKKPVPKPKNERVVPIVVQQPYYIEEAQRRQEEMYYHNS